MKSAPIKNGSSGDVSAFSGNFSVPGYTAHLNDKTVRFTYINSGGLTYNNTTILAF